MKINILFTKQNRRASTPIPIVIFVLATVVVCMLILLILFSNVSELRKQFVGPGVIESIISLERDLHLDSELDNYLLKNNAVVVLDLNNGNVKFFDPKNVDFPDEYLIMKENGKFFYARVGFPPKFRMLGITFSRLDSPLVEIEYNKP